MPASSEDRIGSLLAERWRLTRVLGSGGTATIYEAHDAQQVRVAIKVVHPGLSADETMRLRLLREAYIAKEVDHPGVVRVFETGSDEGGPPFIVMELLEGKSLEALRQEAGGRLAVPYVVDIADKVLDVLAAAHRRSVLHRDLKPGNLFALSDGQIKLLDFGIADSRRIERHLSANTEYGQLMGTPAFMPPEQALGRWPEVDQRSDLWALGATLFTLVTGRPVHEASTKTEQIGLAMSTPARSVRSVIADLPDALAHTIDGALAFERADRWQNADEMRAALHGRLLPRPRSAPQTGAGDTTVGGAETDTGLERAIAQARPAERRRTPQSLVVMATFALGLGVGALALSLRLRSPAPPAPAAVTIETSTPPVVVPTSTASLTVPLPASVVPSSTVRTRPPSTGRPSLRPSSEPPAPESVQPTPEPVSAPPPPAPQLDIDAPELQNRR